MAIKLVMRAVVILVLASMLLVVIAGLAPGAAAQESNPGSHSGHEGISAQEFAVGLAHGAAQGATVFLVGLVAFVVLVWLP
ncbi:MAG: hypothetical protein JOZ19_07135, partial [Rubrobacter sp.]|nr:hypothetical protein [Rubrobacter sp.]